MRNKQPLLKRIYLINRDFQLRYVRLGILVGLGSTVLTLFLVLYPLFQMHLLRFPNFLPPPFLLGIAVAAAVNFVTIALLAVLITHRVAGPMFSLVRHMRIVGSGQYGGGMRVREGDDMKFVIRHFNELVESLREKTAKDRDALDQLMMALREGKKEEALALAEALRQDADDRLGGSGVAS